MSERDLYFTVYVPEILNKLEEDKSPEWGSMTALEMLEHLRVAVEMCLDDSPRNITTPEEKLEAFRRFLISDKPLIQNAPKPVEFDTYPKKNGDIKRRKLELMKALVKMLSLFEKDPDFSSIHPIFGRLNVEEWIQMHRKHFNHHFTQFGLV